MPRLPSVPYALCLMPYALCLMPYALCLMPPGGVGVRFVMHDMTNEDGTNGSHGLTYLVVCFPLRVETRRTRNSPVAEQRHRVRFEPSLHLVLRPVDVHFLAEGLGAFFLRPPPDCNGGGVGGTRAPYAPYPLNLSGLLPGSASSSSSFSKGGPAASFS